jgi:FkbM family methyltransferase
VFVNRLTRLLSRRRRARHFGCTFHRARDFSIPGAITVAGKVISIQSPEENGIRTAFLEILMDDCYGLLRQSIGDIKTMMDIGGNVGFFSLAARDAFPSAIIHCYEPNPRILLFLTSHAQSADFRVFSEAVGATSGLVGLSAHDDSVQVRTEVDATGSIPQVPFRTAIERIGGHCDLVKLDCEGAEWQILSDVEGWRNVDHLTMEYHLWDTTYRHEDITGVLTNIGFKVRKQIPKSDFGIVWASRET